MNNIEKIDKIFHDVTKLRPPERLTPERNLAWMTKRIEAIQALNSMSLYETSQNDEDLEDDK